MVPTSDFVTATHMYTRNVQGNISGFAYNIAYIHGRTGGISFIYSGGLQYVGKSIKES